MAPFNVVIWGEDPNTQVPVLTNLFVRGIYIECWPGCLCLLAVIYVSLRYNAALYASYSGGWQCFILLTDVRSHFEFSLGNIYFFG